MYSRIPMPKSEWTEENMSYAMCFFPLVGAVTGIATYGVFWLKERACENGLGFNAGFWTVLLVLVPIVITGGIHLDGFLDTQDALSAYQTKERRLEILKDPHAGAFAVISCIVYMLLYLGIYSSLTWASVRVIGISFMLSRTLSGLSVILFPQARKQGLAAEFSRNARTKSVGRALTGYTLALCAVLLWTGGALGLAVIVAASLVFGYYYRTAMKKFGGVTGDLAGYFLQICELMMAAAAVLTEVWF